MTRHLVYHVLPVAGNGVWQWNLDQLKPRLGLFDGRKVVAVCTAPDDEVRDDVTGRGLLRLDPPKAVRDYLDGTGCEFVYVPNDPDLREVASWAWLWAGLAARHDSDDVALYAHAKGVTRPGVRQIETWTRMMYETLLDWPRVEPVLATYPLAGCFRGVGRAFAGSPSTWHYHGSFFWVRLRDLFADNRWLNIEKRWEGVEAWPGANFPESAGGLVAYPGGPGDVQECFTDDR